MTDINENVEHTLEQGVESVKTEKQSLTNAEGEEQIKVDALLDGESGLTDIDGASDPGNGILFSRGQHAIDRGAPARIYLSEETPLGAVYNGVASELLKLFNGNVGLENDRENGSVALQSRRGGEISLQTSKDTGIADKLRRFIIDDNESPQTTAEFRHISEITHEGVTKFRNNFGDSIIGRIEATGSDELRLDTSFSTVPVSIGVNATEQIRVQSDKIRLQDAIDHRSNESSNVVWNANYTANRPSTPVEGQRFFDRDLGQPIWYDGTDWVDAQGATV